MFGILSYTFFPHLWECVWFLRTWTTLLDPDRKFSPEVSSPQEIAIRAAFIEILQDVVKTLCGNV